MCRKIMADTILGASHRVKAGKRTARETEEISASRHARIHMYASANSMLCISYIFAISSAGCAPNFIPAILGHVTVTYAKS